MFNTLVRAELCLAPLEAEALVASLLSEHGHRVATVEELREIVARSFRSCDGGRGVRPVGDDFSFWFDVHDVLYSAVVKPEEPVNGGCDGNCPFCEEEDQEPEPEPSEDCEGCETPTTGELLAEGAALLADLSELDSPVAPILSAAVAALMADIVAGEADD